MTTVTMRSVSEFMLPNNKAKGTPVTLPIGTDESGKLHTIDLTGRRGGGIMIAGETGIGKTYNLSVWDKWLTQWTRDDVEVIQARRHLYGFKTENGTCFNHESGYNKAVAAAYDAVLDRLALGEDEFERRNPPVILLMLDDYPAVNDNCKQELNIVSRLARVSRVFPIVVTTRPSSDIMPTQLRSNLTDRIVYKTTSTIDSSICSGDEENKDAYHLKPGELIHCGKEGVKKLRALTL